MRAFACCLAASLALAACAAPASRDAMPGEQPRRVVSLNLCTDELLLLLADPGQIASVSHLAGRPEETPLWRAARRHPANDGSMAAAAGQRADLVLTMGGSGDRVGIGRRLDVPVVDLPFPQHLDDVTAAVRQVAAALGQVARGEAAVARIAALRASAPRAVADTIWIGGGGRTVAGAGLEAQWMALAGFRQRAVAGERVELEELLARPPAVLLRSDYRAGQYSRGQNWLEHPIARAARVSRTVTTDGRRWTCMGPVLVDEIQRLRREAASA